MKKKIVGCIAMVFMGVGNTYAALCPEGAVAQQQAVQIFTDFNGSVPDHMSPMKKAADIANPAEKGKKLRVAEFTARQLSAKSSDNYRIRLLYAVTPYDCFLSGQEIIHMGQGK